MKQQLARCVFGGVGCGTCGVVVCACVWTGERGATVSGLLLEAAEPPFNP